MGVVNYLTDAYEKYAASAISAASLGRNSLVPSCPWLLIVFSTIWDLVGRALCWVSLVRH